MREASLTMSSRRVSSRVLRFHSAVALLAACAAVLPAPCRALALPDLVAESGSADSRARACVTKVVDPKGKFTRYAYETPPAPPNPPGLPGRLAKVFDRIATQSPIWSEPYWTEFGYADVDLLPYHVNRIQQVSTTGTTTAPPYTKSYYDPNDNGRLERTCMVRGTIEDCVDLATSMVTLPDGDPVTLFDGYRLR